MPLIEKQGGRKKSSGLYKPDEDIGYRKLEIDQPYYVSGITNINGTSPYCYLYGDFFDRRLRKLFHFEFSFIASLQFTLDFSVRCVQGLFLYQFCQVIYLNPSQANNKEEIKANKEKIRVEMMGEYVKMYAFASFMWE